MADANADQRQRLFFALWPDAEIQGALGEHARQALDRRRARRMPTENLHITLAFLGEVDAATRACAEAAADRVEAEPFRLSIDRLGYWPKKGLLWAGPSTPPEPLERLAADLGEALAADCDFERDSRPFRAHLTLARKVPKMPPGIAIEPVDWVVERFVLVASETGPEGATYTIVGEWPLTQDTASD